MERKTVSKNVTIRSLHQNEKQITVNVEFTFEGQNIKGYSINFEGETYHSSNMNGNWKNFKKIREEIEVHLSDLWDYINFREDPLKGEYRF